MSSGAPGGPDGEALPRPFGRYVLFDKIGEGGMARIFLARASSGLGGDRLVVVKEILPLLAASAEMSRLLVDEAKLCATLSHRNVVQVTDLGREGDRLYIAMEYVEGLDLRELLRSCSRKKIPLPVEFSLYIVAEVLRALDYAHRKRGEDGRALGIVHRDVSPSNVLLSTEGEVKLCDFGIARAITTGDALPEEAIQGKAGYMSPEAARGGGVDARSDVFAAGIVFWELLSGQRLYRAMPGRPPPLEQARRAEIPALPARGYPAEPLLHGIVSRALASAPQDRYPSAEEMLADLETYIGESRLVASSLRFGDWLAENFGDEIVAIRRERERAARAVVATARPEAPAPGAELPTLPDPNARGISATQSFSEPPPRPASSGSRRFLALLVVVLIAAGAAAAVLLR